MAVSRYRNRAVINNTNLDYIFSDILRKRGAKMMRQYDTAHLPFPTVGEILQLDIITQVWTVGEKYFKLANAVYGDPEYWWIIAWYNQKPLETDFKPGDIVEIPTPLELVLQFLDIT
jgi:hypothetical protein